MSTLTMLEIKKALSEQREHLSEEMFGNLLTVLWQLVNGNTVLNLVGHSNYNEEDDIQTTEWWPDVFCNYYSMAQAIEQDVWVFFPALYEVLGKSIIVTDSGVGTGGRWVDSKTPRLRVEDETLNNLYQVLSTLIYKEEVGASIINTPRKKETYRAFSNLSDLLSGSGI